MDTPKERLDGILVQRGFFLTRSKAKFAIEEQIVYIDGKMVDKPGKMISLNSKIEIKGKGLTFVSRGGLKLEKAIKEFGITLINKVCMDIGASTGGFTDCMLQNRAAKVYAIDVGHEQLDRTLVENKKVINIEGCNIKQVDTSKFEKVDFIGTDVSFISIIQVFPKIYELLKIRGQAVILIKPQFEAGKQHINKNGVVKDSKIHKKVILDIIEIANQIGFHIKQLDFSPIKGSAGNIEYLLWVEKNEDHSLDYFAMQNRIKTVVETAAKELK